MHVSWMPCKADERQSFANRNDMTYDRNDMNYALKTVYGPKSSVTTPLLSADGCTLLTDKDAILNTWTEPSIVRSITCHLSVNDNAINGLPQVHVDC